MPGCVRTLVVTLLLVEATACSLPAGPSPTAASPSSSALLELTNAERARAGLPPLRQSGSLAEAAQIHANQTAAAGQLGHVLPEAPYPHPQDRLAAVGYDWQAWAENLATGQPTAHEVMAGWMQSVGHRANILSGTFTEAGSGHALDASGRPYYAQVFGKPKP